MRSFESTALTQLITDSASEVRQQNRLRVNFLIKACVGPSQEMGGLSLMGWVDGLKRALFFDWLLVAQGFSGADSCGGG
jgi:hypothetical protein